MRIPILTFGAIASIIAINSVFANTVVTSRTYVDNQDALKVNIAQGVGTNNANVGKTLVVNSSGNLELGTVDVPTLPEGTAGNVVTYDSNGDIGGEMEIYDGSDEYDSSTDADKLVSGSALETKQNLIKTNDSYWDDHGLGGGIDGKYVGVKDTLVTNSINGGIQGSNYGIFDGSSAATVNNWGGASWILVNEDAYRMNSVIPTARATAELIKGATKMTCTACRNGQPPCIADECLLWQLPNTAVSW